MADQHDESLMDKIKNALGMGAEHDQEHGEHGEPAAAADEDPLSTDDRAEGWAGVPEALYDDTSAGPAARSAANPAAYEDGASPADIGGTDEDTTGQLDPTREDAASTDFGGAYGSDETPPPTAGALDRGETPPGEASFGTVEVAIDADDDRRDPVA